MHLLRRTEHNIKQTTNASFIFNLEVSVRNQYLKKNGVNEVGWRNIYSSSCALQANWAIAPFAQDATNTNEIL